MAAAQLRKRPPAAKKAPVSRTPAPQPVMTVVEGRIASVPAIKFHEDYIQRKIIGDISEFDIFDMALANKENILIEGPTGPGKTMSVRAWAAFHKKPFYAISSNIGMEPSQLFGKFIPDGKGSFVWQDGPVTDIVRRGGVLLLNEVNFTPERISTVLFPLLDAGRLITLLDHKSEVIEGHEDLLIVADMNPEYEGTRPLNKAFRNRFEHQIFWDYDPVVEKQLVKSGKLLELAQNVRARRGEIDTPVSTNMLMEFENFARRVGIDYAVLNFSNHFHMDERETVRIIFDAASAELQDDFKTDEQRKAEEKALKKAEKERLKRQAAQNVVEGEEEDLEWVYDEDQQS
jgi:MoxR-like ATPase